MIFEQRLRLFFLFGSIGLPGLGRLDAQPSVAGTYRIAVCKQLPCIPGDSTRALVTGTLVLLDTSIVRSAIPDSARWLFNPYEFRSERNGCYALERLRDDVPTNAGGVSTTSWYRDSLQLDRIHFTLYRSPDALHAVSVRVGDSRLEGGGYSAGVGAAATRWPRDSVVAVKVGPADPSICINAELARRRNMRNNRSPTAKRTNLSVRLRNYYLGI
jgi:hypothetical protein